MSDKIGYTVREALAVTGVGRNSLLRAIHARELKAFRVGERGKKWIIPRQSLEMWMSQRIDREDQS